MSDTLVPLYHHLPAPARSIAASLRGYYLRSWRYGAETERLVAEALEREHWSPERWKAWQEERLAFVLHRAARHVPYYREQWAARRCHGDRASWEYLENWPILGKEPLRENPIAFVADDCDVRRMFHEHTSGTTGKSLDL
jgi:phenylacetate-CoA ligase